MANVGLASIKCRPSRPVLVPSLQTTSSPLISISKVRKVETLSKWICDPVPCYANQNKCRCRGAELTGQSGDWCIFFFFFFTKGLGLLKSKWLSLPSFYTVEMELTIISDML